MPRNVLLPCVISCDVATGEQLKDCREKKRIQFVSLLVFQGDTFSFQSSSLNPTHYCVTRTMKQLFSYKSIAVLRKRPSSVFYCCSFLIMLSGCRQWIRFRQQTTSVKLWGGQKCINHLRNSHSGHDFNSFESENKHIFYLFDMLICNGI